jgi:hypothetical protein
MPCSDIDSTGAIHPDRVGIEIDDLETLMTKPPAHGSLPREALQVCAPYFS